MKVFRHFERHSRVFFGVFSAPTREGRFADVVEIAVVGDLRKEHTVSSGQIKNLLNGGDRQGLPAGGLVQRDLTACQ